MCAACRSSPNVIPGAGPARTASARAASSGDSTRVSSSMIRTCTGWICPAASAANVGRQPGGDRGRVPHLLRRRLRGQVQLEGQLIGGELISRPGPGMPGGVLRDRGHLVHSARDAIRRAAEMTPIS